MFLKWNVIFVVAVCGNSIRITHALMPPTTRSNSAPRPWSRRSSSTSYGESESIYDGGDECIDQSLNDESRTEKDSIIISRNNFEVESRSDSFSPLSSLIGGGTNNGGDQSREKIVMAIALFTTYFSVMGAKCALPSTFNQLTSHDSGLKYAGDPQLLISRMLVFSTGAISVGKLLLGPLIDKYGGVACLKFALLLLMSVLGIIASTTNFVLFAISWILVDFTFSSCWAACLNAIHSTFQEEEWASRIGLLAVAGRVGNVSSFFLFASVLGWAQPRQGSSSWRLVFWLSSAMQLIPLFTLSWFKRAAAAPSISTSDPAAQNRELETRTAQRNPTTIKDSLRVLKKEAESLPFWMHLTSRSCLMIIASFLLFVPSYMTNAFGMTDAASARVGALYAFGSLLSVSIGAKPFSASCRRTKIVSTAVLLGLLLGCGLLQMAHITGAFPLSPFIGATSMFIWGVTFSIPFYIPPSMYALKRGGRQSSATIADAFDFVGFILLAWFNGFVAGRQQDILRSWLLPFGVLSGFTLTAIITSILAIWSE